MKKYRKGKHEYKILGKGVKEVRKVSENIKQKQIQINIDEETAMGKYANVGMITHNAEEFIFDFAFIPPGPGGQNQAKLRSRVIISPGHAKRFLSALSDNISKYESKNGKISMSNMERNIGFN